MPIERVTESTVMVRWTAGQGHYRGAGVHITEPDELAEISIEGAETSEPKDITRRVWIHAENVPELIAALQHAVAGPMGRLSLEVEHPGLASLKDKTDAP